MNLEVVEYLVQKCGARLDVNDNEAIKLAANNDQFHMVKYLVSKMKID